MNIYNIVPNPMTFIEMLIDAIYEYFDRYINLVDIYISETESTCSLSDNEPESGDTSDNEESICTHTLVI